MYNVDGTRVSTLDITLNSGNTDPKGITYGDNKFFVVDNNDRVYVYTFDGTFIGSYILSLGKVYGGITYVNDYLYTVIANNNTGKVYGHQNGLPSVSIDERYEHRTANPISNTSPTGLLQYNGILYSVNESNDKVYVHKAIGNNFGKDHNIFANNTSNTFDLFEGNQSIGNRTPEGMTVLVAGSNSKFYVVNDNPDKVFAYDTNGTYPATPTNFDFDFDLTSGNTVPRGISYTGGNFYVVDSNDHVYKYNQSGNYQSNFKLTSNNVGIDPAGIYAVGNRLFVSDNEGADLLVYDLDGNLIDEFDAHHAFGDTPKGVTANSEILYIVDVNQYIYRYDTGHLPLLLESGQPITSTLVRCTDAQDNSNPVVQFDTTPAFADGYDTSNTLTYTCTDTDGNSATHDRTVRVIDTKSPKITITSSNGGNNSTTFTSPINFTITFDEIVTGLEASEINLTVNGTPVTVTNLAGSDRVYTFSTVVNTTGPVKVNIPANVANDGSTKGNEIAPEFTLNYTAFPIPTITSSVGSTGSTTNDDPVNFTITFDHAVTGLLASEISLSGSANPIEPSLTPATSNTYNTVFTFSATPVGDGDVVVNVPANVATDANGDGDGNVASATSFTLNYDATKPILVITSSNGDNGSFIRTSPINFTITSSEPVSGFNTNTVNLTTGTANLGNVSGFTANNDNTVFTFNATPADNGTAAAVIFSNVVTDSAGNGNEIPLAFILNYDSTITSNDFTLAAANPRDVAADATNFYIVDSTADTLYTYPKDGSATRSSLLATANDNPTGLATDGVNLYVTNLANRTVYVYSVNDSGDRLSVSSSFVLATANSTPTDIATDGVNYYVVNSDTTDTVYVYSVNDPTATPKSFTLNATNSSPSGIAIHGTNIYVVDNSTDRIYVYLTNGLYSTSFELGVINGTSSGLATDGDYLYVSDDGTSAKVYTYHIPTTDLSNSFPLNVTNLQSRGITSYGNNLYVADFTSDTVYVYFTSGVLSNSFTLNDTNTSPTGIATHGTKFYVTDDSSNTVYVYLANGTLHSSFALDVANDSPAGITTNGTSLYVLDHADDFVYVYSVNNTSVPPTSFALDSTNYAPTGITIHGTNIYVVDQGAEKIFVYLANGTLHSSFALNTTNIESTGITIHGTKLYVNDDGTDRVYTYDLSLTPTITSSNDDGNSSTDTSPISFTVTFDKTVTGFTASDVILSSTANPSLVSDFTANADGMIYTFSTTSGNGGTVLVDVAAGVATDGLENDNVAADQFIITYDDIDPTPTITSSHGINYSTTNSSPISFTITFDEIVTGFTASDVTLSSTANPSLVDGFTANADGRTFTFSTDVSVDGTILVDVASGVASDTVGNNNVAATQFMITFDNTAPNFLYAFLSGTNSFVVVYDEPVTTVSGDYTVTIVDVGSPHVEPPVVGSGTASIRVIWNGVSATSDSAVDFTIGTGVTDLAGNALASSITDTIPSDSASTQVRTLSSSNNGDVVAINLYDDTFIQRIIASAEIIPIIDVSAFDSLANDPAVISAGNSAVFPRSILLISDLATILFPAGVEIGGFALDIEKIQISLYAKDPADADFEAEHPNLNLGTAHIVDLGDPTVDLTFSTPVKVTIPNLDGTIFSINSAGNILEIPSCGEYIANSAKAKLIIDGFVIADEDLTTDSEACFFGNNIWTNHFSGFGYSTLSGSGEPSVGNGASASGGSASSSGGSASSSGGSASSSGGSASSSGSGRTGAETAHLVCGGILCSEVTV